MVFWLTTYGKTKASFALGHFGVNKPTSSMLHDLWNGAFAAATTHGYKVLCGCCDGASEVRSTPAH